MMSHETKAIPRGVQCRTPGSKTGITPPHSSLKGFRYGWSAIAGVLLMLCVTAWPATGHADDISDWNRLTLKLEPPRSFTPLSRAAAMVHVAMHDAINAIPDQRRYATYLPPVPAPGASAARPCWPRQRPFSAPPFQPSPSTWLLSRLYASR